MKGEWREKVFHNENPIVLELGCGKGEYTVGLARRFPDKNFIGIDVKGHRFHKGAKERRKPVRCGFLLFERGDGGSGLNSRGTLFWGGFCGSRLFLGKFFFWLGGAVVAGGVAGVFAESLLEVGGRAEAAIDGDFRICAVISRKAGEGEVDADAVDFFVGGAAEGFAEAGLEAPARDRQVVEHLVDPKPGGGLFANDSEGLGNDGILDFDVAGGESLDGVAGFDERDRRHGAALHKIVKSLGGEESDAVVIRRNGAERNCAEVADELFVVAAQDSHIVWDGEVECRTGLGDRMGKGVAECENAQTGRAGLAESLDGRND
jgi:hypothetical protein